MDLLKELREIGKGYREDTGEPMDDITAYEVAAGLLEDPEILKAAKKLWPGKSKQILQEIIADRI